MRNQHVKSTQRTCRQRALACEDQSAPSAQEADRPAVDQQTGRRSHTVRTIRFARTVRFARIRPATLAILALLAALALLGGQPAPAARAAAAASAPGPEQGWWQPAASAGADAGQPAPNAVAPTATPAPAPTSTPAPAATPTPAASGTGGVRSDIIQYTVQAGDTLYGLAGSFNVSVETLIWANNLEANPASLSLGQELTILPVSGVLHTVQAGDTLGGIAAKYDVSMDDIRALSANHLSGDSPLLQIGQKIIVPGGAKLQAAPPPARSVAAAAAPISAPAPANAPAGSSHFVWPVSGTITQGYRAYHRALDIGGPAGAPVKASDSGYVAVAGWSNVGYGNYVIIDHGNGYRTLYAHLSRIDVKPGAAVAQGQVIGAEGATGNATGPHLHFELLKGGAPLNPFDVLP